LEAGRVKNKNQTCIFRWIVRLHITRNAEKSM